MKTVLLIAPTGDFDSNTVGASFTPLFGPPMGILALASYLAQHDVAVELLDVSIDIGIGLTEEKALIVEDRCIDFLKARRSDFAWIGLSMLSSSNTGLSLARRIHREIPEIPLILGGYFPSSAYGTLMKENDWLEGIVRGDGEEAALAISRRLEAGSSPYAKDVPNLVWRDGPKIIENQVRQASTKDLPIFDFQLLSHPKRYQVIALVTSRGCPYSCNYCLESGMRSFSKYPAEWFQRQLDHLRELEISDRIILYDPIFGLGEERSRTLAKLLGEHEFRYEAESRGDALAPALLPLFKKSGLEVLFLGVESASPATLCRMNKVRSREEGERYVGKTLDVLRACFENDVTPIIAFMFNFPGDELTDYEKTTDFVQEISKLYVDCVKKTGNKPGFVPLTLNTGVYEGSPLHAALEHSPEPVLLAPPVVPGIQLVREPSPGLDTDVTRRFMERAAGLGAFSPVALERLWNFYVFSLAAYLRDHPEMVDDEGVIVIGESFESYAREFDIVTALMHYGSFFTRASGDSIESDDTSA